MGPKRETLIGAGSFRVDKSKALEKFQNFQLPTPEAFVHCWARFAVASGAKELRFKTLSRGLELAFEGRPLGPRDMADPYSCLLEEDGDPRLRHMAFGILGALRLGPRHIRILSGTLSSRQLLTITGLGREEVVPAPGDREVTFLRVEWPFFIGHRRLWEGAFRSESFTLCPAPVRLDDDYAAPGGCPERALSFREGPWRGWVMVPHDLHPRESSIEAHTHGVRIGPVTVKLPTAAVFGHVNHDRFGLNASLSGIVRDQAFERMERLLDLQAARLIIKAAKDHAALLAQARWLRPNPKNHKFWMLGIQGRSGAPITEPRQRQEERVRSAAHATAWLRDAAARLLPMNPAQPRTKAQQALWCVPLFFGNSGRPLNLLELDSIIRADGRIQTTYDRSGNSDNWKKVRCDTSDDLMWLKRRFTDVA